MPRSSAPLLRCDRPNRATDAHSTVKRCACEPFKSRRALVVGCTRASRVQPSERTQRSDWLTSAHQQRTLQMWLVTSRARGRTQRKRVAAGALNDRGESWRTESSHESRPLAALTTSAQTPTWAALQSWLKTRRPARPRPTAASFASERAGARARAAPRRTKMTTARDRARANPHWLIRKCPQER